MITIGRWRAVIGGAGLGDREAHGVELVQEVVGELEVGLVNFVDQNDQALVALKCPAERSKRDVTPDVADLAIAEAAIMQAPHGIVLIEPVHCFCRGFDMPALQWSVEEAGDVPGEQGLACPWLTLHKQRPPERDRDVHRPRQLRRNDVFGGPCEALHRPG
jgi:hypothetical protein